jgi:hypothetical protein
VDHSLAASGAERDESGRMPIVVPAYPVVIEGGRLTN